MPEVDLRRSQLPRWGHVDLLIGAVNFAATKRADQLDRCSARGNLVSCGDR
jgi:hypothetical protein